MSQEQKALEMIKKVHEDQEAEINGRSYKLTKLTHKKRRKIFAFFSHVQGQLMVGDMVFLDSPDFEPVEKIIESAVLYNGSSISTLAGHWDEYPQDYVLFIQTMLATFSYPFLNAAPGN